MPDFSIEFTPSAEDDLAAIARYTMQQWGKAQALKYAGLLDACFQRILSGSEVSKPVFPGDSSVRVCRCEHHYVFYLRQSEQQNPVVVAVLHERMDLMQRLRERLPSQ
jgi:plasmid stabilization system protein ParE